VRIRFGPIEHISKGKGRPSPPREQPTPSSCWKSTPPSPRNPNPHPPMAPTGRDRRPTAPVGRGYMDPGGRRLASPLSSSRPPEGHPQEGRRRRRAATPPAAARPSIKRGRPILSARRHLLVAGAIYACLPFLPLISTFFIR
jgi:hypothetical protein